MAAEHTAWGASTMGGPIPCPAPREGTRGTAELERRGGSSQGGAAGGVRAGLAGDVGLAWGLLLAKPGS